MSVSIRYWAPKSAPSNVQMILSVDRGTAATGELDIADFHSLMARKVAKLVIDAGSQMTVQALEMSPERLPEMASIRSNELEKYWQTALMNSDAMMQLLNRINWRLEMGERPIRPTQAGIRKALSKQTLADLIEHL